MNETVKNKANYAIAQISMLTCAMALIGICAVLAGCAQSPPNGSVSTDASTPTERIYTEAIAKGATSAHLLIEADAPLADNVSAANVKLDGALYGFEANDVKRLDDNSLSLAVSLPEGAKTADDPYAYVILDEAAFAQPHEANSSSTDNASDAPSTNAPAASDSSSDEVGQFIALRLKDPTATIVPQEGSYNADKHEFVLPISLGYAEFTRAPEAADFVLADSTFTISSVDYNSASLADAKLHVALPEGATPREAFDKLDTSLTKDGIIVAASATNCGKVTVGSNEMREAERNGYKITALASLAPQPAAYVEDTYAIESKTQDDDGETDYDTHLRTRIDAAPGTCALPEEGIGDAVKVDHLTGGDEGQILGEDVIRIDGSQLYLNVYLPSKVIEAVSSAEGEDALAEAQRRVAQFARVHKLVLEAGVLSNAWGVPEPKTEIPLFLTDDLGDSTSQSADDTSAIELVQKAYALETDNGDASNASSADSPSAASTDGDGKSSAASDPSASNESDSDNDSENSDASDAQDDSDQSADDDSGNSDDSDDPGNSDDPDTPDDSGNSDDPDSSNASDDPDDGKSSGAADIDPEELRSSYADSDATDVEESEDGAETDDTYGSADLTAYNLANDDDDLKKAKEAFEIMEKIFETAGAFAEFAAEDNPAGLIEGIGGIFGFISQAIGLDEGDLVNLQDVMERLDHIDKQLSAIDSKIDQLSHQLDKTEKNLGYHEDLNTLRAAVFQTETYGEALQGDVWNNKGLKWEYDDSKGFDGLSPEQLKALELFLKHIDIKQSTYGYNAAKDTIVLGNLIVGDPSLAAKSVLQEYNDCIDTMFNWEPETYVYKQLFMSRLMYAYTCGYTTAITQLQYKAWKSGTPEDYTAAMKELTNNYKKVHETVQGKVAYEKDGKNVKSKVVEESKYAAATHDDGSGKIKNLVTSKRFDSSSEQLIYLRPDIRGFCHSCSEPDEVTTYEKDGSISEGDFDEMVKRLVNTKYKSLWDEIVAMTGSDRGFVSGKNAKDRYAKWTHKSSNVSTEIITAVVQPASDESYTQVFGRILVGDATRKTLHNQASHRHTYNWTANYYDLHKNCSKTAEIYIADQIYRAGQVHWTIDIDLHPYYTMKAA